MDPNAQAPTGIQGQPQNSGMLQSIIAKLAGLVPGKGMGPGIVGQHTNDLNASMNPETMPGMQGVPPQGGAGGPQSMMPPPHAPMPSAMPAGMQGMPPGMPGGAPAIPPSTRMAQAPITPGNPNNPNKRIGGTEMNGRPGVLGQDKGFTMKQKNPVAQSGAKKPALA